MSDQQPNNPLHGVTLKALLEALVERHGWAELAARVPIRCFKTTPTIKSSLTFLRKTPWARAKVEQLYLDDLRRAARNRRRKYRRRMKAEHDAAAEREAGAEAEAEAEDATSSVSDPPG